MSLERALAGRRQALTRQIRRLERQIAAFQRLSLRLSTVRLFLFLIGFVTSVALFLTFGPEAVLLALPLWFVPFVVTIIIHRRLEGNLSRYNAYLGIKQRHLAAMNLNWEQIPAARFPDADRAHPYSLDLDIQGKYSLHRLLDNAATIEGSRRLLDWLLESYPDREQVEARQPLIQQLAPMSAFRDKLHLNTVRAAGPSAGEQLAGPLMAWLQQSVAPPRVWLLALLIALGVTTIALLALALAGVLQPVWLISLLVYFALYLLFGRGASTLFRQTLFLRDTFEQIYVVFEFLEGRKFAQRQALVRALCEPFVGGKRRPSTYVTRLTRITAAAGLAQNPVLWLLLNIVFPWDLFFTHLLYRLRERLAELVPEWLDVLFELEAASALASLQYLNPHYSVPQFLEADDTPPFAGLALGHPLIPEETKVRNDFTLLHPGDVVLITGSNMSGKSTFLRTLGVNLCLAYAGGPVSAGQLHTRFFRLFTSVRMSDSVTDGISYFYAEVKRLKLLLEEVRADDPRPVFFLIDEIFRGTNNRERLIGSRAYIRALVDGNGLGVVSTHDLELVSLADDYHSVTNYHFRDSIVDGRMIFDYQLHPGPSPTTNALKIMRYEGLPVEDFFPVGA